MLVSLPSRPRTPTGHPPVAARAPSEARAPFGRSFPITRRSLRFFASVNSYSIEAAKRELGYAPVVGLGEGMKRVVTELGGRPGVLGS